MFERFTEHARKVIALAKQEAQFFGHDFVGTEHLLWGLAKESDGVAAAALERFGVDLKPLRKEIEAFLESRPHVEAVEKLPETPEVKDAIKYAIEEARALHHNHVGTEHLLLGLLREPQAVAAQVLANLGLNLEDLRQKVKDLHGSTHHEP